MAFVTKIEETTVEEKTTRYAVHDLHLNRVAHFSTEDLQLLYQELTVMVQELLEDDAETEA